ncbi:MAG: SulP family inorganic anion transporter [Phycisphaeraceae bacterium]|nr:SulP family inorganic anion transporter [Phycisphaeraceae bacterium]
MPTWRKSFSSNIKIDILSGLTVALALVPEAVAFSFVAGVDPLVGLYAAFMVGLITSLFGGRPGMISGATGAVAVVLVALVASHGIEYMFVAVLLAGVLQFGAGLLRLGKLVRLVPESVMFGFVNGLAIIIFLAQLSSFQNKIMVDDAVVMQWMTGNQLYLMVGLVLGTMAIILGTSSLTKAIPAPLVGIAAITLLVHFLGIDTTTVGDLASIEGGLPSFHIPGVPFNLETLKIIFPYAAIVASVGLIESLMTMSLLDEMTETRGRGNRECMALGVANMVNGVFGGMGGCAMIGQSVINIESGGRGRLSGFSASMFLLMFVLFASGLIEQIPIAALTGVMFMVVIGTFEWSSFRVMGKIPRADAFVIVLVSGITVMHDLAIAVFVGVIVSALVFAWEKSKHISCKTRLNPQGWKIYELDGPLFFGAIGDFRDLFLPNEDPDDVIIDFAHCRVYGHSGLEAIDALGERYRSMGKKLHLVHLSPECKILLEKAGDMVEINMLEDPHYHLAVDELA